MVTKAVTTTNHQQAITEKKAMYWLKTIWPQAPETEIVKAAMICATYGLNPLLKQVSLIRFAGKNGADSWVTVLGIKATRNIALGTGHKWSYVDGPRVMTEDEQKVIFGQTDADRIWAITRIRDTKGNEYPGYGFWPRASGVYGADKGNSPINMAFIRSERNALDKMAPGELPNTEVSDESFIPVQNIRQSIEEGKHEAMLEAEQDAGELWDSQDAPPPHVAVTESKASDLKAMIDERKLVLPVRDYMMLNFGKIIALRQLTNDQADGIIKYIENMKK